MAAPVNPEAQALADLQSATSDISTAIATEIVALQAALNAQGVNNTPAIEASVTKMRTLIGALNSSLTPVTTGPAAPVVSGIAPASGPVAGGTSVVITGTGFTGATGVTFSSIPATSFVVNSDTQITAVAPPGAVGTSLPVLVTTPSGVSTVNTLWSYGAASTSSAPTVASLSPISGPAAGGTSVTITGSGFTGATAVSFGGSPATSFAVVNDTTITAVTASSVAGSGLSASVTTPGGPSVANTMWSYV